MPPSITHRGERHGDKGYFIKPTIFTDVRLDMKIVKKEIFGPVAAIIKIKDEAEVYGLGFLRISLLKMSIGRLGLL